MYCSVGLGTFSDESVWRHGGGWEGVLALKRPSPLAAHSAGLAKDPILGATSLCDSTRRDVQRRSQAMRRDATQYCQGSLPVI